MNVVGFVFVQDCNVHGEALGEVVADLDDLLLVEVNCCERVIEMPSADFNEILVDCGV